MPWPFTWAFITIYYGTAFQIGYFKAIGLEFLSFAGVGDWLFVFALAAPIIVPIFPLSMWLHSRISDRVNDESWFQSFWWFAASEIDSWRGFLAILLGLIALALFDTKPWSHNFDVAKWIIIIPSFVVISFTQLAVLGEHYSNHRSINVRIALQFLFITGVIVMWVTEDLVKLAGGTECSIKVRNEPPKVVRFMRYVPAGYLFLKDDATHFVPTGQVLSLSCEGISKKLNRSKNKWSADDVIGFEH